ncbi:uncharacterized protein [Temnothorax nylanderi]|uniref:uncharacterized protein n=1 Tax=Temnothorax nylanderi TaxID=102681 RepID=UPI003A83E60D
MQETCKCKTNNQDIHDKLTDLQDKVNSLIESHNALKEIMEKIVENDNVHVDGVNLKNTFYEGLEGFPMSTVEEFKELESDAKKNDRRKLYNYLRGLGGCKLREFLYNAIKTIMTDSLVSKFTWPGSSVSEKFGDTKTMNIIYLAAQKCTLFNGPQDKASCKVEVQEVLRAIKQRYRTNLKKNRLPLHQEQQLNDEVDEDSDLSNNQSEYETE